MPWGAMGVVTAGVTNKGQCTLETGMCKFSGQEVKFLQDVQYSTPQARLIHETQTRNNTCH